MDLWDSWMEKHCKQKEAVTIRAELFYCYAESCTKLGASWFGFLTAHIVHVYLYGSKVLYSKGLSIFSKAS